MKNDLFAPFDLSGNQLGNRIVMAPMTRRRAENPEHIPVDFSVDYYKQRASAGLIVSEGSQVSPQGYGYTDSPGCYSKEQMEAWKKITDAVHEAGGKIFLQLWHVGPYSHPLLQPEGALPLAASAVKPIGQVLTPEGHKEYVTPKPMTEEEIYQTVEDFGHATMNAKKAGFDGVEIHGAHGYVIDQFLRDGTNLRKDDFGGSFENRSKLLFMIVEKVIESWSADRTGLRLSPTVQRPPHGESDIEGTFGYITEKLNDYQMAYLHISEMIPPEVRLETIDDSILPFYRKLYKGNLISCGGYTRATAEMVLDRGYADLIAFGKLFVSNPDLVKRLSINGPLTEPDTSTFYHGGRKGYIDYPFLNS
jgi:N-ethylmaleimide reductase